MRSTYVISLSKFRFSGMRAVLHGVFCVRPRPVQYFRRPATGSRERPSRGCAAHTPDRRARPTKQSPEFHFSRREKSPASSDLHLTDRGSSSFGRGLRRSILQGLPPAPVDPLAATPPAVGGARATADVHFIGALQSDEPSSTTPRPRVVSFLRLGVALLSRVNRLKRPKDSDDCV